MHTASAIERILAHGAVQSSYKYGVLRAVVDEVIAAPAQAPRNGFHRIPVVGLALRVLATYWPLVLGDVRQTHQARPGRIPRAVRSLAAAGVMLGGRQVTGPSGGVWLLAEVPAASRLPRPVVDAILEVRAALLDQPLRHLPNTGDRRTYVFSLLTEPGPGDRSAGPWLAWDASYEDHRAAAPGKRVLRGDSWLNLLAHERTHLVLSARAWEEVADLRYWLKDAITLRWVTAAEGWFTKHRDAGRRCAPPSAALFEPPLPERDGARMAVWRALYDDLALHTCIYTGQTVGRRYDLDHVLPHARFPVDQFWNLVPTRPETNRAKRALLPPWTAPIRERYRQHLHRVVSSHQPAVHRALDATWRQHLQAPFRAELTDREVVDRLTSLLDLSRRRLEQAGVGEWARRP